MCLPLCVAVGNILTSVAQEPKLKSCTGQAMAGTRTFDMTCAHSSTALGGSCCVRVLLRKHTLIGVLTHQQAVHLTLESWKISWSEWPDPQLADSSDVCGRFWHPGHFFHLVQTNINTEANSPSQWFVDSCHKLPLIWHQQPHWCWQSEWQGLPMWNLATVHVLADCCKHRVIQAPMAQTTCNKCCQMLPNFSQTTRCHWKCSKIRGNGGSRMGAKAPLIECLCCKRFHKLMKKVFLCKQTKTKHEIFFVWKKGASIAVISMSRSN